MILKCENDQRTIHFALTSPSHHQSGLEVVVSTLSKTKQWVVVSSSFLSATFSSIHTALQSFTKVAHFSLRARGFSVCRSTQLPGASTRRTAEVVWRANWADPDFPAPRRKSAGRASTSARIGALRVVRIDLSTGADTSSARTRGGGRPTELKVVTITPENRDGPFSVHDATRKAADILDTPFQSITRCHVVIPENLFANVVFSVHQLWLPNWRAHDERLLDKSESMLDGVTILDFCWHVKIRGTCLRGLPECYSDDVTAIVQFL